MTILISHRGNINGENPTRENHPDYIERAIKKGYDVEIDLWVDCITNQLFLGHDKSQYEIDIDFLFKDELYIHCKDLNTLRYLFKLISLAETDYYDFYFNSLTDFFFHDKDTATLTYRNRIWEYPKNYRKDEDIKNSIIVLPERFNIGECMFKSAFGICSDVIEEYTNL